ncbi:beta-Ala-His dipeptidase [Succinimonas amylolytica]|uniref:beta-Ala-His dipeptidase n=1 Tax=Succinimonas amylolytica TaxID=83769 RepID=UPI0023A7C668
MNILTRRSIPLIPPDNPVREQLRCYLVMENDISNLEPRSVWHFFSRFCQIPHTSGNETGIGELLLKIAQEHGLDGVRTPAGNIILSCAGSPGLQNRPRVFFQAHMDMVGVKESGSAFDFSRDAIKTMITGNGFVTADGTTLGADDGIGMALALAVMTDPAVRHPPLSAVFTVSEETDMGGALALTREDIPGKTAINIDSEDIGEICIGCAGGISMDIEYTPEISEVPPNYGTIAITIENGKGGHSGMEVDNGSVNAATALLTLICSLANEDIKVSLSSLESGTVRNAIPGYGKAEIALPAALISKALDSLEDMSGRLSEKYRNTDPGISVSIDRVPNKNIMMSAHDTSNIIKLRGLNTGVLERTPDGQPLTSCNLGRLVIDGGKVQACILGRHATESGKELLMSRIEKTVSEASAHICREESYPAWEPDYESPLARIMSATYRGLLAEEPRVTVIHAGLECGLLKNLRPDLDIVSVGPNVFGAHTPEERVEIASVRTCYDWILKTLEKLCQDEAAENSGSAK